MKKTEEQIDPYKIVTKSDNLTNSERHSLSYLGLVSIGSNYYNQPVIKNDSTEQLSVYCRSGYESTKQCQSYLGQITCQVYPTIFEQIIKET